MYSTRGATQAVKFAISHAIHYELTLQSRIHSSPRLIVQFGGLEERAESKMLKCEGSCCVLLPIAYNSRLFAVVYIYFYIININIGHQVKRHTSKVKKYCFNLYNYSS